MFCAGFSVLNLEIVLDSTDDFVKCSIVNESCFQCLQVSEIWQFALLFWFLVWLLSQHCTYCKITIELERALSLHTSLNYEQKKHMHIFRSVFYRTCQLFVKFENSQHTVNYRWPLNKPQKSAESHVWLWNQFSLTIWWRWLAIRLLCCVYFFLSTTRIPLEWSTVRI